MDDPHLSAAVCSQRGDECLALAEKMTDPYHQAAMLKFAEWWMRLAQKEGRSELFEWRSA